MSGEGARREQPDVSFLTGQGEQGLVLGIAIALCVGALMLDGVDIQMMAFAAPLILKEWGIERLAFAPALGAALAGMVVGAVLGGLLGDRWGRRPAILLSLLLSGVLTLMVGASRDMGQMVPLRFLSGIGFGALYPNVFSLIGELAKSGTRSRVVILATIGTPLGGMLGAIATGWAMPEFGWRACFYAAGGLTLVLGVVLLLVLPESPRYVALKPGGPQQPVGMAQLGHGVPRGSIGHFFAPEFLRRTMGLWILACAIGYAAYAFLSWAPVLLSRSGLGLRLAITGSMFVNLFTVMGTFAMAATIPRIGSRLGMLSALAIFALGSVALGVCVSLAVGTEARVFGIMASLACVGLGVGATGSCTYLLGVELYPVQLRATGGGLANALSRLGAVAVAFGGGILLSQHEANAWSFLVMVLFALAVAVVGNLLIDAHLPSRRSVASLRQAAPEPGPLGSRG